MTTDTEWTWTIIMAHGKIFHVDESITVNELLFRFISEGYQEPEIEAIIRH